MKNMGQVEQHYHFTSQDAKNLLRLQPVMEQYKTKVAGAVYDTLLEFEETAKFLPDEAALCKRKESFANWFMDLFKGAYDQRYLLNIQRIGYTHVRIGLDPHYMNSSMYLVREFCLDVLEKHFSDPRERLELTRSVEKILDINLDIMSSSYRQEELSRFFLSLKLEGKLIRLAERFSYGLNLILVIALMGISLGIIGMLGYDIWKLTSYNMEHGVIKIMGALLMLWVMIELMDTEIKHLKKGTFSINIFIEVALVAFIRDALVSSLERGDIYKQIFLIGGILALGFVYWLISLADKARGTSGK